ncbi:hypothetical protein [Streptomyces sp. NPDC127033]|uniref:hypothetical protein n=1 Tax=Streptomyces sp. NPDC127033 TaxID=3347110 RepID=UPI0036645A4D
MGLQSRIFVTREGCDVPETAIDLVRRLGRQLAVHYKSGQLAGYETVAITELGDFENEEIDRELVESVTCGQLPAIYVNLTFELDSQRPDDVEIGSLLPGAELVEVFTEPKLTD